MLNSPPSFLPTTYLAHYFQTDGPPGRYAEYFTRVLHGVRPSPEPLVLKRVILHQVPNFAGVCRQVVCKSVFLKPCVHEKPDHSSAGLNVVWVFAVGPGKDARPGCCPYVQVFKGDALLFSSAATGPGAPSPPWVRCTWMPCMYM